MKNIADSVTNFFKEKFANITAETLGWLSAVILHAATIPSLLAVMAGITDKMPSVDIVLLVWGGLSLLYAKAIIQKDMLNIVTIGIGFIAQSVLMVLIFFK
jgi:hypothetical protein